MEGKIFDIKRYAVHDGPGIRTTVFLTGCPLECWWCHNPESITFHKIDPKKNSYSDVFNKTFIRSIAPEELLREILKDRIFFEDSGGGVTFSGGEPLIQHKFLNEVLKLCRSEEIHTTVDTCGLADRRIFKKIYDSTDLFLFDVKLINDSDHKKYTGASNKLIHKNLKFLLESGIKVRIRIPLIPGITDTDDNLENTIEFIKGLNYTQPIDLLPYNKISEDKFRRLKKKIKIGSAATQTNSKIKLIKEKFSSNGFKVNLRG